MVQVLIKRKVLVPSLINSVKKFKMAPLYFSILDTEFSKLLYRKNFLRNKFSLNFSTSKTSKDHLMKLWVCFSSPAFELLEKEWVEIFSWPKFLKIKSFFCRDTILKLWSISVSSLQHSKARSIFYIKKRIKKLITLIV